MDLVRNGTPPGYPDVYNQGYAEALTTFVIPRMVQRVVIDNWTFDDAIAEAESQLQAIYAKY
jgi:multiple sugar transport system substrate-binding protein